MAPATDDSATKNPVARRGRGPRGLPRVPDVVEFPYADINLQLSLAEKVHLVMNSNAWRDHMSPKLATLDAERSTKGPKKGKRAPYEAVECEEVILAGVLAGRWSISSIRSILTDDDHLADLHALGCKRKDDPRPDLRPVPSKATFTRHLRRFPHRERLRIWKLMFDQIRHEGCSFRQVIEACRILQPDATDIQIAGTAPVLDKETKEVTNGGSVTVPDAGFVPPRPNGGGDGYKGHALPTITGLPLSIALTVMNHGDGRALVENLLPEFDEIFYPHLLDYYRQLDERAAEAKAAGEKSPHADAIGVLTGDAAYSTYAARVEIRRMRMLENIQRASKADNKTSRREAAKRDTDWKPIRDQDKDPDQNTNWEANGHFEFRCRCGKGHVSGRYHVWEDNSVTPRCELRCDTCGDLSITGGHWRLNSTRAYYMRLEPGDDVPNDLDLFDDEEPDAEAIARDASNRLKLLRPALGNFLTFHSRVSARYGNSRFGRGESFWAHLSRKYGVIKEKRQLRDITEASTHLHIVCTCLWIFALDYYRRENAHAGRTLRLLITYPADGPTNTLIRLQLLLPSPAEIRKHANELKKRRNRRKRKDRLIKLGFNLKKRETTPT